MLPGTGGRDKAISFLHRDTLRDYLANVTVPQEVSMELKPFDTMSAYGLIARPLTPDDCPTLFEQMFSDNETMLDLVIPRHTDAWATHAYITESMTGWQYSLRYRYGLFGEDDGALTAIVELTPRLPQVELGVMISRQGGSRKRRKFILALRVILDWLITQPGVYRVFACCAVDGRAHSSMERLGFCREGTMINYEARPNRGLVAGDSYLYAMTRPVAQGGGPGEARARGMCDHHNMPNAPSNRAGTSPSR
ncbi:GNAT family N-acetyltransferase [Paraburkholderia sp. EG287B]|uniref:GNAT family N-acetyltransferase n=1 Tax=unclassified Paraburkholderia TaxID=2615204 RepID=UPI0034D2A03D